MPSLSPVWVGRRPLIMIRRAGVHYESINTSIYNVFFAVKILLERPYTHNAARNTIIGNSVRLEKTLTEMVDTYVCLLCLSHSLLSITHSLVLLVHACLYESMNL